MNRPNATASLTPQRKNFALLSLLLGALFAAALLCAGCSGQEEAATPAPAEPPAAEQEAPQPSEPGEAESDDSTTSDSSTEAAPATPAPSTTGPLQVKGAQLCGADGQPVQLKGVSTHGLSWFPQYVNQPLFTELRQEWNASVVRLAMYTAESGGYCTDGNKEDLYALVKDGVNYATSADLYVIVDWHILADGNPLQNADAAANFFSRMSADLAENNNVIYEICNEPNGNATWTDIKSYAQRIIPLIRANDPDAVILVGTPTWSQEVDKAAANPLDFDNIMYTMHFYAATHTQDLRDRLATAVEGGLPVFVSEFGICDASGNGRIDYESADAWVQLMDQLNVSYICWNLSNKNEASALFRPNCSKTSGFSTNDLSAEGQWLWEVLHADVADANANGNANSAANGASATTPSARDATSGTAGSIAGAGAASALSGSSGPVAWSAQAVNSWESGGRPFTQYDVTVTNKSDSAITTWQIAIPFNSPIELTDSWNGQFSAQEATVAIQSVDYNGNLAPNASATDVGFIVCGL